MKEVIMQAMIEFVNSNSLIAEQHTSTVENTRESIYFYYKKSHVTMHVF